MSRHRFLYLSYEIFCQLKQTYSESYFWPWISCFMASIRDKHNINWYMAMRIKNIYLQHSIYSQIVSMSWFTNLKRVFQRLEYIFRLCLPSLTNIWSFVSDQKLHSLFYQTCWHIVYARTIKFRLYWWKQCDFWFRKTYFGIRKLIAFLQMLNLTLNVRD